MIRSRDRAGARHALKDLATVGAELPETVTTAVALLDRIEAERPIEPAADAVQQAILDGATAKGIAALVAEHLGHDHHQQQHRQALDTAGARVLAAIRGEADTIHAQLAQQAEKLIEDIEAAAAVNAPVSALVRDGRTDEARLVADADHNVAALQHLYDVRNMYLCSGSTNVDGIEGGVWRDPAHAEDHYHQAPTTFAAWAAVIRAGGRLWFPTAEQAREVAAPIAAEREREAREAAAAARAGTLG